MGNFIDRTGEVNYNNQGEKMTIIRYSKLEGQNKITIDIQFEDGIIVYNKYYDNFKKKSIKHPIRYEESFAYHIEVELGLNLDDIWNWDKNNENDINPYEIYKCGTKKVWLYCQEKDYHNYDREGNKIGYKIQCSNFYNGNRCNYCRGQHNIHYKDSLAYKYPQIAKMIAIEENGLTFEDCYNIAPYSNKKFYFKCLDCNKISNKQLGKVISRGYSCDFCSDGLPITEKFMANILKQLDEDFITQLNKLNFEWCGYFKYDFYLPKYNMIIEVNGLQHYEDTTGTWDTSLFKIQMNDLFKYKCAKSHVDNYIVIDCRYSELEWMKENVKKELNNYFDLSNINWELAWEESQNSLCIKAWELWNNGIQDIKEISKILKLSQKTITRYLKRGNECKKCNYIKK